MGKTRQFNVEYCQERIKKNKNKNNKTEKIRHPFVQRLAPCKWIQDGVGFWIPRRRFRLTGTWVQSFVSGNWILDSNYEIPDSLSCIPDSKVQDSALHKENFPGFEIAFRNPESFTWGKTAYVTAYAIKVVKQLAVRFNDLSICFNLSNSRSL